MKTILLGVTGSVAAIKVKQLAERLSEFAQVRIVMTHQAEYFLAHDLDAFKHLNITTYKDQDEWPHLRARYQVGNPILHIELRRWAECLIVAPLSANTLAKIAHGFCDNLLTSVIRVWDWRKPMLLCPAMNTMMWENPPTAQHINLVKEWGAAIIEPIEKQLACNDVGMGAMAEVEQIIDAIKKKIL